jgi:hypothetical protein
MPSLPPLVLSHSYSRTCIAGIPFLDTVDFTGLWSDGLPYAMVACCSSNPSPNCHQLGCFPGGQRPLMPNKC